MMASPQRREEAPVIPVQGRPLTEQQLRLVDALTRAGSVSEAGRMAGYGTRQASHKTECESGERRVDAGICRSIRKADHVFLSLNYIFLYADRLEALGVAVQNEAAGLNVSIISLPCTPAISACSSAHLRRYQMTTRRSKLTLTEVGQRSKHGGDSVGIAGRPFYFPLDNASLRLNRRVILSFSSVSTSLCSLRFSGFTT